MIVISPEFMKWIKDGPNGLEVVEGAPEGTAEKLEEWLEHIKNARFEDQDE